VLAVPSGFNWSGSSSITSAGTLSIPVASTLTIADASTKTLQSTLVSVAGNVAYTGTNTMNTGQGSILRILAGATMTMSGAPTIAYNLGGAVSSIENLGTLVKNTSAGTAVFGSSFVNSGTLTSAPGSSISRVPPRSEARCRSRRRRRCA
jgi:hypothetical protein